MCNFFSCLVTKNDVLYDLNADSHEELVKKFKFKDDGQNPSFVRVECVPKDANIWNHKLTNWETRKDQDLTPDWFDIKEADTVVKKELKKVFKALFKNKGKHEIKEGRLVVSGSATVKACGSATVEAGGSATVKACGSATVEACGSATVEACGESNVIVYGGKVELHENAKMINRRQRQ